MVRVMLFKFGKFFKQQFQERMGMNKDRIKVNNHTYLVALNEQTQMYARKLRGLYQQGYSDVDSFDEVSSEISNTVNNLLKRILVCVQCAHGFAKSAGILRCDVKGFG